MIGGDTVHPHDFGLFRKERRMNIRSLFKSKEERELEGILSELCANLENNYKSTAQAAREKLGERCETLYAEGRLKEAVYRKYKKLYEEYSLSMRNYHH